MRRGDRDANVLFVCTANVCRSPLAEQYLRARLSPQAGLRPVSAGLVVSAGTPMDPFAAEQSRLFGGDPDGARSAPLTDDEALDAALILTMTRRQRKEVATRFPRAVRRTYLLADFSALIRELSQSCPTEVARVGTPGGPGWDDLSQYRRRVPGAGEDIPDPIGCSREVHHRVATMIVRHVETIVTCIRPERDKIPDS